MALYGNPYGGFGGYNGGMIQGTQQPYNPGMQTQPQTNILPPQQILQANGKTSIDAIRLSPNSSVLVMDTTAPIIWLCASDSIGTVTKTPYDITAHTEKPPVDMDSVEQRLVKAEKSILRIMEVLKNGSKPDDGGIKPKPAVRLDSAN